MTGLLGSTGRGGVEVEALTTINRHEYGTKKCQCYRFFLMIRFLLDFVFLFHTVWWISKLDKERIGSILFPKEDRFYPDLWISADFRFFPLPGPFVIQRYGNRTQLLEKPCAILR
jgi:hypothetical protein